MNRLTIIGSGNVAYHLCDAFRALDFEIDLFARNTESRKLFAATFQVNLIENLSELKNQFVLLCVNDSAIPEVIGQLDLSNKIAYTSGTLALKNLPQRKNLGVFYPLQSFSIERKVDFFKIPFFIEANNEYFAQELFDLAWKLSRKVEFADSEKRKQIHLAAVIANNFTNHLLFLAKNHLDQQQIDWKILQPLVTETFAKAFELNPESAQTGPAKRDDKETLQAQLALLDSPLKEIYLEISNSILESYKHEKL